MVFRGQPKTVLYVSETERTVCIGWHGGHVGPGTICACVLLFLHSGCFCVSDLELIVSVYCCIFL